MKFRIVMLLAALGAIAFGGCVVNPHSENEPGVSYFTFQINDIGTYSADIEVSASEELSVDWYWDVVMVEQDKTVSFGANDVLQLMNDEWLMLLEWIGGTPEDFSFKEFMALALIPAGTTSQYKYNYLVTNATYIVWACGFNAEGEIVGDVEWTTFKTKPIEIESVVCYDYGDYYENDTKNFLIHLYMSDNEYYVFDLIAPKGATTPVGEYSVGGSQYDIIPGSFHKDGEDTYVRGSYMGIRKDEEFLAYCLFIVDGTVSIKRQDGKYQIVVDCVGDDGAPIRFDYEGDFTIEDLSQQNAPAREQQEGSESRVVPLLERGVCGPGGVILDRVGR